MYGVRKTKTVKSKNNEDARGALLDICGQIFSYEIVVRKVRDADTTVRIDCSIFDGRNVERID